MKTLCYTSLLLLLFGFIGLSTNLRCQEDDAVKEILTELETQNERSWTLEKVCKSSDAIVIGKFLGGEFCGDRDENTNFQDSTFEIIGKLRGEFDGSQIVVRHVVTKPLEASVGVSGFEHLRKTMKIPTANAVFKGRELSWKGPIAQVAVEPEYLIFLKMNPDGVYSPISGFTQQNSSIQMINCF